MSQTARFRFFGILLILVVSFVMSGCLAFDSFPAREEKPISGDYWPLILGTKPGLTEPVVLVDKKCTRYRLIITNLVNSEDGSTVSFRDVYVHWFMDYSITNSNPDSTNHFLDIFPSMVFTQEAAGKQHVVTVLVSDLGFTDSGSYINYLPLEGAHWDQKSWVLQVVDDRPARSDDNCIGGFNED